MLLRVSIDGTIYEFNIRQTLNTEAIAIQKVTGYNYSEWLSKVDDNDFMAITALIWIILKRGGQTDLKFSDVKFTVEEWSEREWVTDSDEAEDPPALGVEAETTESN